MTHTDHKNAVNRMLVYPNSSTHFGEHVMIDGYDCSAIKLDDRNVVLGCLNELPAKLLMKPLAAPEIYFAKGGSVKDPGGWTGIIVIEESHISIHTFPIFQFVSIDVYTCKNGLDVAAIEDYFRIRLGVEIFETKFVKRGRQFGRLALPKLAETFQDRQRSGHAG